MIDFSYERDEDKFQYGVSKRWPAERLLVRDINDIVENRPSYKMRLLGTSGVHGEKFPLFKTECQFTLPSEEAVQECLSALKVSDELIRRRDKPGWDWQMAWTDDKNVLFFVNWFDFAYFMKHRFIFMGKEHGRYSLDFGLDVNTIEYQHYRILEDGSLVLFDEDTLSEYETTVVEHLDEIQFEKSFAPVRFPGANASLE